MTSNRTYSEMLNLKTFDERFEYLKLSSNIGIATFGFDRYINQRFYHSQEWKRVRDRVIVRDNGCDLGLKDYPIFGKIYVHHMNPISLKDIHESTSFLLNPENLICVSLDTHNSIHYGSVPNASIGLIVRKPNDTCPWKKETI